MYFPSKKDLWLYPIMWCCIIACFAPIFIGRDYEVLFFTIPLAVLLIWSWFATGYSVKSEILIIQNGPVKKKIPIKDIKKITPTKNPLSAPALSLDRLELIYGSQFGMAIVSPKDKQAFSAMLKSINPEIEVDKRISGIFREHSNGL